MRGLAPDSNVSGAERSYPEQCGFYTHWRPGFQVSDNEQKSKFSNVHQISDQTQ
jgi:hypothetical protein